MKRDAAKRVAVVMATQPLYVVAVRSMAQFVGGERKYNGLLAPFKEIVQENGIIGGFYRVIQVNATNGRLDRKLCRIDIVLFAWNGLGGRMKVYLLSFQTIKVVSKPSLG